MSERVYKSYTDRHRAAIEDFREDTFSQVMDEHPTIWEFYGLPGSGKSLQASIFADDYLRYAEEIGVPFQIWHLWHLNPIIFGDGIDQETFKSYVSQPPCEGILYDDETTAGASSLRIHGALDQINDMRQIRKSGAHRFILSTSSSYTLKEFGSLATRRYHFYSRKAKIWQPGNVCPAFYEYPDPQLRWRPRPNVKGIMPTQADIEKWVWEHQGEGGRIGDCRNFTKRFNIAFDVEFKADPDLMRLGRVPHRTECAHRWYFLNKTKHKRELDIATVAQKASREKKITYIDIERVYDRLKAPLWDPAWEQCPIYRYRQAVADGGPLKDVTPQMISQLIREREGYIVDAPTIDRILTKMTKTY